jgi:hypothetical protein
MAEPNRPYLAYLLRLWQVSTEQGTMWRAAVESPHTAERRAFATLDQLFAFLEQRAGEEQRASEARAVEQAKED